MNNNQERGILLHISSLPSNYGIGTFGKSSYEFVDFLADNGFTLWQVLPLSPTSYGDSPYQSPSAFAGNPYFIDLDTLAEEGLLKTSDFDAIDWGEDERVDYGKIYNNRTNVLRKAAKNFVADSWFAQFKKQNLWVGDYAVFMCIKQASQGGRADWLEYRHKSGEENFAAQETDFWEFVQFKFWQQYSRLKDYANSKGIKIIGDMPIYVANDSVDFWANKQMFLVDGNGEPNLVAGVPPDLFSDSGQLWGNPLYNWQYLHDTKFKWWVERINHSLKMFDMVRIDHFRGFESFWAVPVAAKTAQCGEWLHAYGLSLFNIIWRENHNAKIIAEDLGTIDASVRALLAHTGYPGMRVMQFGFDTNADSEYLPNNYVENCIAYTGTHDNTTSQAFYDELTPKAQKRVLRLLDYSGDDVVGEMIRQLFDSKARYAIVSIQDFMRLGKTARMNTPSTQENNWQFRLTKIPKAYNNKDYTIK